MKGNGTLLGMATPQRADALRIEERAGGSAGGGRD